MNNMLIFINTVEEKEEQTSHIPSGWGRNCKERNTNSWIIALYSEMAENTNTESSAQPAAGAEKNHGL